MNTTRQPRDSAALPHPPEGDVEALITELSEFAASGRSEMRHGIVETQALALPVIEMCERAARALSTAQQEIERLRIDVAEAVADGAKVARRTALLDGAKVLDDAYSGYDSRSIYAAGLIAGAQHCARILRALAEKEGLESPSLRSGEWRATHRHVKSGNLYRLVARGHECTNHQPVKPVVIYESETGSTWVRSALEFDDGRFVELSREPSASGPSQDTWIPHEGENQ